MKAKDKTTPDAAIDSLFCPIPRVQSRSVLRANPDVAFLQRLNYSDQKWREQIRQEIETRWRALNKGESPKPITNERGYRKITKQVEEEYLQLHRLQRARIVLWMQSERTLNLLRSKGLYPKATTDQVETAMLRFIEQLDADDFPEIDENLPQAGPNEIYELARPKLVADYGYPFYSTVVEDPHRAEGWPTEDLRPSTENIVGINCDFWAALLGGDKRLGHDVVYFVPEACFYFFDLVAGCYLPTTEEKVRLVLSQALQKRAWGQGAGVAATILEGYRSKTVVNEIMIKAKALLSAEKGFFVGPDARPRLTGSRGSPDVGAIITSFVKEHVQSKEDGIMTLGECLLQLGKSSEIKLGRKEVTEKINDAIRMTYNKGLRNDLRLEDDRTVSGWKGLSLKDKAPLEANTPCIRNSVDSASSEPMRLEETTTVALAG